ncbi:trypsin I-P1-like [Hylaeus volcanicus]|uniref:trypsin I-P1-like n=1 Tax=Hylaeus volcanicus TaxID=313075 RepID=UPI0023B777C5|nr:trypsin I-P1-like [Hylaeus volcanicus]
MLRLPLLLAIAFPTLIYGNESTQATLVNEIQDDGFNLWDTYQLTGRIVNGTKAALRQFPYQVSLRRSYSNRHFCGGSLIDEYYVLTAAHCMYMDGGKILPWTISVVAGELQLDQNTATGQTRGVKKVYVHSDFDLSTLQNDIALLQLKEPFKLTQEVMVAPLTTDNPVPGTVCQVAGWGYPAYDYPVVSNDLMYVDLPVMNINQCKALLVNVTDMPPGMFCAGYVEGQRDACQGDSGGGMICNGVLTGVVSGGEGCAFPGYPGVYSNIFFFEEWILKNMDVPYPRTNFKQRTSGAEMMLANTILIIIFFFKILQ